MRLGRDALIFTKNGGCQTVGMLSQTYLENIKAQAVIVPIVPFNQQTNILQTRKARFLTKTMTVCVWAFVVQRPRMLVISRPYYYCGLVAQW